MTCKAVWLLAAGLSSMAATAAGASVGEANAPAVQVASDSPSTNAAQVTQVSVSSTAVEASVETAEINSSSDEPATEQQPNRTEVVFTPYLWVAGTSGDIGIPKGDGEVEIDKSFTDILGNLKFAFMGALDVRHDRFVVLSDIMYLSVGADVESVNHPDFVTGEVDASVFVGTLAAGYRVVDRGPMFLDVFAGVRLLSLDVELELEGPLTTRNAERSPSQLSPLLGARARFPLGKNFGLVLYGDAGGFVSSDIKWQFAATAQWDVSHNWRIIGGYRYLSINRDTDDFKFDVSLSGPVLGVSYRF